MSKHLLSFMVALFAVCAIAQDDLDMNFEDMSLEDLLNVEVTVASKNEETAADAPSSVSVFTRAEIQNMGITDLYELVNYVPGFQSMRDTTSGRTQSLASRGRLTSDLGTDILVLVNGRRLNESHTGGATEMSRLISIDHVKQVEIIRGPGSALYGSNAFLGVINIVTVENNEAIARGGTLNYRDIAANLHGEEGDWRWSVFARGFEDEGQSYDVADPFGPALDPAFVTTSTTDPQEGFDALVKIGYKKLTLSFYHSQRNFSDFYQFDRLGNGYNREETQVSFMDFKWTAVDNDRHKVDLSGGITRYHWDALARILPATLPLAPGFNLQQNFLAGPILTNEYQNLALDWTFFLNERNTINAGVTFEVYENTDSANQQTHDGFLNYLGGVQELRNELSFVDNIDRDVLGVYIQDKFRITDNFSAIVGVRYDDYSDFGDTTNPRGALIWNPFEGGKFKVMYGEAFRAPVYSETAVRNNPQIQANPTLDPEAIQTIEVAYVQSFSRFQGTITYFDNTIEDAIIFQPVPDTTLNTPVNSASDFEANGFELEIQAQLSSHFLTRASFTSIDEGTTAAFPEQFGSLVLNFNMKGFNANFNAIYRDKIDALPNQDSYWVGNLNLRQQFSQKMSVGVMAKNVFDEDYLTPSSGFLTAVPNRGRQYWLYTNFKL